MRRLDDRRPEDRRPEERGETRAVVHRAEAAQQQHARTLDSEAIKQYRSIQQNTAQPGAGGGQQRWVASYACQWMMDRQKVKLKFKVSKTHFPSSIFVKVCKIVGH